MKLLIIAACLTLTQSTEYSLTGPTVIKIKNGEIITEESDDHTTANTLISDKVSSVVKDYIAHKNFVGETGINSESVKNFLENHAAEKTDHATNKIVTSYKFGGGNEIVLSIPKKGAISKKTEKHVKTNSIKGKTLNLNSNDLKDNVKHNVQEYLENLRKNAVHVDNPTFEGQELLKDLKFELSDDVNTSNFLKDDHHESSSEECTITGKMKNRLPNLITNVKEFREDILGNKINYNKVIQDKIKTLKRPEKLKYYEINNRLKPLRKTILKNKKVYYNKDIKHLNDIKKAKIDLGKKYYKNKVLTKSKPLKYDQLIRKKYKNLNKELKLEKRYTKAKHYMHELKKTSKTLSEPDKIYLKAKLLELKTMKKPKINFDKENIRILTKEKLQKYYTPLSERQKLIMTDFELSHKLPEMKTKLENFQRNLANQSKLNILNDKLQQLQNIENHKIHFDKDHINEIFYNKIAPKYDELLMQQGYKTFLPDMPQFGALDYVPDHLKTAPSMRMPKLKHKLPAIHYLHNPHINFEPYYTPLDFSLNSEPLLTNIQMPAKQRFPLDDLKTAKNCAKKKIMKDLKKQKNLLEDYEDLTILDETNFLRNNKLKYNYLPERTIYKIKPVGLLDTLQHYADEIVDSDFSKSSDKLKFLTNDGSFNEYDILKERLKLKDVSDERDHLNIDLKELKNKALGDTHQTLFNRNDILKEKIHKLKAIEDAQDNLKIDFNSLKYKANKHHHYKVTDGSEILKGKLNKLKDHVEDAKDQLSNNLDRLKFEKTLAVPNGIDILDEKKCTLNDYVKEADDSIDINLHKLKDHAKKLILSNESEILKEKLHELENNVEEAKHHIDNNLERLKFEKKLSNKITNTLQEKKDQLNDYIKEAEDNIDTNLDKIKKNAKEKLALSEGSDIIKQKIHEWENNVEKTKDRIDKDLERLKFEKNLAISDGINTLKEKNDKLNDYVKEAEENIDINLDKLKNNSKKLASSDGRKSLKEKVQELENNLEETKHHIDNNLEKLNYEKDLAISSGHQSLKEKMHKVKDSVKDTSDRINYDVEKLKHDSQKAAISYHDDDSKQHKHETEEKQKETHDHSRLSKLKHDVNNLVTSNEHALKHKVDNLKSNIKNIHDDSSLAEKSRKDSLHESNVDEGSLNNYNINKEFATGISTDENDTANQEKIGDGRKKLKQYTITQRRKKKHDKKVPVESQIPSSLENVSQEEDPSQ